MKLCKHTANVLTIATLANHTIYWCKSCGAIKDMYELCDVWELPYSQVPKNCQPKWNKNWFTGNEPGGILETYKPKCKECFDTGIVGGMGYFDSDKYCQNGCPIKQE